MVTNRFRVAFSFAGEKRDFVEKTARILAGHFGQNAILYDKFHEAEFAVYDLGIRLPMLYGERSDLIVPVLSPAYDAKRWTGWEWVHIYGLLTHADGHRVMPSRFGHARVDGLSPAAGFIELDDKTPEEFATLILERLAINEGNSRDHYFGASPTIVSTPVITIPHNLPALQPFFGREEELQKIADAVDRGSRTWGVHINGRGGMGKTSLAIRAAYDAADAFHKIAFVSLKRRELDDDGVRDLSGFLISGLAELLNELARELRHADVAKVPEEQRPRLLLDALRDTRTLLVLDNLESLVKRERDTIFTFVKKLPPGCKAILTSRGRIGSATEELILKKLSEKAALDTLAKLAESNPVLAETNQAERLALYQLTGGSPLLLRWTAGQIGRGSCLTFADALHFLRSCPEGNDPLEFVFGDLTEDFSEDESGVLSALTYFTLPARVEHITNLTEGSETHADRALRSLVNRSLVVPSEEFKTFSLVPLVADFLRKKKSQEIRQTGDRLEERAYALAVENGRENHLFPVLEAAWPTVSAALPLFLAGPNDRLQTVCTAVKDFLDFTGRWDERLALERDAARRASIAGDSINAGWRALDSGWIYYLRGQSTEVFACVDRAEAHWREAQVTVRERSTAILFRGHGYLSKQEYQAAIDAYSEVVAMVSAVDAEGIDNANALTWLAIARRNSGARDGAESDYRQALRIYRIHNHNQGIAMMTGNLADLALLKGDWSGAEALLREAIDLSARVGRLELLAWQYSCLARALLGQGKKHEALPSATRAVEIYTRLGSPNAVGAREILAACES